MKDRELEIELLYRIMPESEKTLGKDKSRIKKVIYYGPFEWNERKYQDFDLDYPERLSDHFTQGKIDQDFFEGYKIEYDNYKLFVYVYRAYDPWLNDSILDIVKRESSESRPV